MTDGRVRLERALRAAAEVEPAAAHAAGVVLATLFDQPGSPWDQSPLSRDGYPVELGVVPGVPGLRYTVELPCPAPLPSTPLRRVERTVAALRRLGATVPELRAGSDSGSDSGSGSGSGETVAELLCRIQRSTPEALKYGAWLSGRHGPGNADGIRPSRAATGTGRFKLYLEVPPDSEALWRPWERSLFDQEPPLPTRSVALRMGGIDLAPVTETTRGQASRIELYYDLSSLNPTEVAALAGRAGLGERASEILHLLRRAVCLPLRQELPARCDWGFSYALELTADGASRPRAFTLYTFANALFGGDGRIRRALLALGKAEGWDLSLYEQISRPLAARRGFLTCHGVFGVTVTDDPNRPGQPGHPVMATWGLAPPPEPATATTMATPQPPADQPRPTAVAARGRR